MRNKKKNGINRVMLVVSIVLVVGIPFVFDLKTTKLDSVIRGFPFDWLVLYPNNGFSFKGLGFLVNILVFYLVLTWLVKGFKKGEKA